MKSAFDLYKIISESTEDEIYLDDVDELDESYIELNRNEVKRLFNDKFDSDYMDGSVVIAGETFKPSEIFEDMRPEEYEKALREFCDENDIKKYDGRYYAKADSPVIDECENCDKDDSEKSDIVTESKTTPVTVKTDQFCDFEISVVSKDNEYGYKIKEIKPNKIDSPEIISDSQYDSAEKALEAAKIHVNKIQIKNELNARKIRLKG